MSIDWTPLFINTIIANRSHQKIDSDYWNALWNLVITQGDNNATGIQALLGSFGDAATKDVDTVFDETSDNLPTSSAVADYVDDYPTATSESKGFMSSSDKTFLDRLSQSPILRVVEIAFRAGQTDLDFPRSFGIVYGYKAFDVNGNEVIVDFYKESDRFVFTVDSPLEHDITIDVIYNLAS